jgi:hypothetical protein
MALFIACILIHGFGLSWGWYLAAVLLWLGEYILDLWWSYAFENDKIPPWAER